LQGGFHNGRHLSFLGYEDGFLGRIQGVKNPGLGFVHQPCQLVVDTCGAEKQETR
jgi:hypothetical protein